MGTHASSNQNKTPAPMKIALLIATIASLAVGTYAAASCATYMGTGSGNPTKLVNAATCTTGNTASCVTYTYTNAQSQTVKASSCDTSKLCQTASIGDKKCKIYKNAGVSWNIYCSTTQPANGVMPSGTSCPVWSSAGMTKPSVIVMAVAALFAMAKLQ